MWRKIRKMWKVLRKIKVIFKEIFKGNGKIVRKMGKLWGKWEIYEENEKIKGKLKNNEKNGKF